MPVIFLDTVRLFPETLAYRDALVERLGLTDVRTVTPDPDDAGASSIRSARCRMTDPDLCCHIRKTEPLARALDGFDAWFTGRKRFQADDPRRRCGRSRPTARGSRSTRWPTGPPSTSWPTCRRARPAGASAGRAGLSLDRLRALHHPVAVGEDPRAGRWRGLDKTECGIHLGARAR